MDAPLIDATVERAGERFRLLPERAMLWEGRGALCVADLHWGRESLLQRRGMAVPDTQLAGDMARLDRAMARTRATALWVLGDWFHHPDGLDARTAEAVDRWWAPWRGRVALAAVLGNHDRGVRPLLDALGAAVHAGGFAEGGVRFTHDPGDAGEGFAWGGHVHPSVRLPSRVGDAKVPCFWVTATRGVLPAFSGMAAGALVRAAEGDEVFVVTERAVRRLDVRRGRRASRA